LEYRVLGPVGVANNGDEELSIGGPLMRRLLAVLVIHADRVVTVDHLIEAVWGDRPPATAPATLQTYVSRLRRALGADHRLVSRSSGYVLVTGDDEIDSRRFQAAAADGRAALAGGNEDRAVALLTEALGLWRGRALLEFADEPWAQPDARRLDEERLVALEDLGAARVALGPTSEVVPDLERLVTEHPLRERPLALLMTALYRSGRHAEALRVFHDHRVLLGDELGLQPSADLRLLERQILDQDPSLARSAAGRALRGYRLTEQIGVGSGDGETWLAVQPAVGREVVIKTIPAAVANDPQFIRRFEAEAQIVAALEHPHIVPVYDYWREAGGAYIVMRYLRGGSLAATLQTRRTVNESLMTASQIGDALAEAHRHGVTHGQLSAADVLLDSSGAAYVSDFSIGAAGGERPNELDDIRALGLLLAEMLAAPYPFDRRLDAADQVHRLRPEISPPVLDIVASVTRTGSGDELTSASEFAEACSAARPPGSRGRPPTFSTTDRNPYKGLRSFEETDAVNFFGRDSLVADLVERLRVGARFVAVIGPSGSGKSSLVRAGLLPAVRRGAIDGSASWFVTSMTPGEDPLAELAMAIGRVAVRPIAEVRQVLGTAGGFGRAVRAALPDDGSELLLFVDQLEEVFTVCQDEDSRRVFLDGIAHAAFDSRARLRIVTTMRADFYDRPLQYRAFALLLDSGSMTIAPPSPQELEAAITGPAARAGVELESGLMSHLVTDLGERPAALPLLQFTMAELFDQRRSGMLTLEACKAIGGVTGALAHRADATFRALAAEEQQIARRVFCRLVVIGDGGAVGARRVAIDRFGSDHEKQQVGNVLDRFAAQRLLTFDRDPITRAPTVEIAHESLITAWPALSAWVDEDRDALRVRREVELASRHWDASGRDDSDLYRGMRLDVAAGWSHEHPEMVEEVERQFIAISQARAEQALAKARRSVRRQRQRLLFAMLALVVAVIAASVAIVQRRNLDGQRRETARNAQLADQQRSLAAQQGALAEQQRTLADSQRTIAETQRTLADARRLSARAGTTPDKTLALLLAVEANDLNPSMEARSAVAAALSEHSRVVPFVTGGPEGPLVAASLDGQTYLQSDDADGRIIVLRRAGDGSLAPLGPGLEASTQPGLVWAAFDHADRRVATFGVDGSIRMFDLTDPSDPKPIGKPVIVAGQQDAGLAWNLDDSLLAVAANDGAVVFRIEADQPVMLTTVSGCEVPGCATPTVAAFHFSPTERSLLAVKTLIGPGRLVDVESGAETKLAVDGAEFACCGGVGFAPNGKRIAVTMGDAGVAIFDSGTGALERNLSTPTPLLLWTAFADDGTQLIAGDQAGNVIIWDASSWRRVVSVQVGIGATHNGGFLGPGRVWLFAQSLVELDIDNPALLYHSVTVALEGVKAVLPSPEGSLTVADSSGVSEVDGTSGTVLATDGTGAATALGAGPDNTTVAVGRSDGRVQLLDAKTLETRTEVGSLDAEVEAVATRGGTEPLIAAATDQALRIWSTGSGAPRLIFDHDFGPSNGIRAGIAFALDGTQLAANFVGGMALIDLASLTLRPVVSSGTTGGLIVADPVGVNSYLAVLGPTVSMVDEDLAATTAIPGSGAGVVAAAFSPDGSFAVTGDLDGSIAMLDVESRSQFGSLMQTPFGGISSLAFLPKSDTLVTAHTVATGTSTIAFWNLDPTFLIEKACEVAGRDLTAAEWDTYLPGYDHTPVCP
jgi:DNA-binding SARP family transcriptional activator/WD40 repeat protein